MILKKSTTTLPKSFLFSAAAVVVAGAIVAYGVRQVLFPPPTPICAERYGTPVLYGLVGPGGRLMTSDELQGRLEGRDWGLTENAVIARFGKGPGDVGFNLMLPAKASPPNSGKGGTSGMGFTWLPQRMDGATSACLGYSVYFPSDFDFSVGGVLPGLFGTTGNAKADAASGSAPKRSAEANRLPLEGRLTWQPGGSAAYNFRGDQNSFSGSLEFSDSGFRWPTGKWVRVEQEIVLNDIDRRNGAIRVWIDGDLMLERKGIILRGDEAAGFAGVTADTHYADAALAWKPAPKASKLSLTTFELWWN